jgi:hypothetical protein
MNMLFSFRETATRCRAPRGLDPRRMRTQGNFKEGRIAEGRELYALLQKFEKIIVDV